MEVGGVGEGGDSRLLYYLIRENKPWLTIKLYNIRTQ